MYFNMFPPILYSLDNGTSVQVIQDIARRITLSEELKANNGFFDLYDVQDGETPEILASKFYKNSQYHWIILLTNDIIDPRYGWPLAQNNLVEYAKSKYGQSNLYSTHHFINASGYEVNSNASGAVAVTNFEHEDILNEDKRRIKILSSDVVTELVSNFEGLIAR